MTHATPLGRVYLVRHGQTAWNASGRAQGHTDIALDEVGLEQAKRAGERFAATHVDEVWSSDLARCTGTAAFIAAACGRPILPMKALRERTFGAWEGDAMADVRLRLEALAREHELDVSRARPPAGESQEDVWERALPVAQRLRLGEGTVVIVSHGGLMSVLLASLLRGTVLTARSFRLRNASITELERGEAGGFRLVSFDDTSHLGG